jgi:hypothetical protein
LREYISTETSVESCNYDSTGRRIIPAINLRE